MKDAGIGRLWRGWTTPENADVYEQLLHNEVMPGIARRRIRGYLGANLFRRDLGDEVEFATLMWFESLAAVTSFMGDDYAVAHVPAAARKVLKRFDQRSIHYEHRKAMKAHDE